jgi:hypothetical protein
MKRKIERMLVLFLATMILAVSVETIWPINPNDQSENRKPNMRVQAESLPNDPYWNWQWGLKKIEADWAWNATLGNSSVLVAIIDSGIDYTHPDLTANYVMGGFDWVNNDTDPMDDYGHGTRVAGVAAAVINNEIGIAGLAQVKIMAEKVLDRQGEGFVDQLANGIYHATNQGAKIISISLSTPENCSQLYDAVKYAYEKNVLLVAAAGNQANNTKRYPAAYDEVIAVASTDENDQKAYSSNYGDWIELAAPGVYILTTVRGGGYDYWSGTSYACPHVSGLAALLWSEFPNATRDWIRNRLRETTDDLGDTGFDEYYGYGRINARKAIYGTSPAINYTLGITTIAGGTTNPLPGNYTYTEGQNVPVQAIPNTGYGLDHWELDEVNVGSANPYSVLMDNNHTLQAVFVLSYTLTITTTPGGATNPSPGSYLYNIGINVSVTATPDTCCIFFDCWELDGINIGSANPYLVLMDNNHTLHAVFVQINYTLTITATAGGTTSPAPSIYTYAAGSSVQVTASPNTDYTLDYWELDSINIGIANPLSLTIEANHTLKAVFRLSVSDIAVTKIILSKTIVGQGFNISINVTVANQGDFTETFNVTTYANQTLIGEIYNVELTSRNFTTILFTWNTTGLAKGNYTISAVADTVPGETDTADNELIDSWVFVGLIGDINADGIVDIADIYLIALSYGAIIGTPQYKPNLNINSDGIIDIEDIYIAAIHYGEINP